MSSSDEETVPVKSATDLQRLKLERLMKNIDRPAPIPERRKEKNFPKPPDFIRNVMGSSAGAGSGEFHVYRHLRRKEYSRANFISEIHKKEELDEEFHQKIEQNKREAEEKTAKKRAKRQKQKEKEKAKRQKLKELKKQGLAPAKNESEESGDEEDEANNKDEEAEPAKKEESET